MKRRNRTKRNHATTVTDYNQKQKGKMGSEFKFLTEDKPHDITQKKGGVHQQTYPTAIFQ